jgi:hypothetical protein
MFSNIFWNNQESNSRTKNLYENYSRTNKYLPANFIRQRYPLEPTYINRNKVGESGEENDLLSYDITYTNNEGYSKIVTCNPQGSVSDKTSSCSEKVCNKVAGSSKKCHPISSTGTDENANISKCVYQKECGVFKPTWEIWYDSNDNIILPSDDEATVNLKVICNSSDETCKISEGPDFASVVEDEKYTYSDYCGIKVEDTDTNSNITVKGLCTTKTTNSGTICNIYQCNYSSGSTNRCSFVTCDNNYERCEKYSDPTPPGTGLCDKSTDDNICFNQHKNVPIIVTTADCSTTSCKITECDVRNETCVNAICATNGGNCENWTTCNYIGNCTPAKNIFTQIQEKLGLSNAVSKVLMTLIVFSIFAFIIWLVYYFDNKINKKPQQQQQPRQTQQQQQPRQTQQQPQQTQQQPQQYQQPQPQQYQQPLRQLPQGPFFNSS